MGAPRGLRVLGYGELTLVIGWPTEAPVVAVKRLPPFTDADRLDAYAGLLERYVEILRSAGRLGGSHGDPVASGPAWDRAGVPRRSRWCRTSNTSM